MYAVIQIGSSQFKVSEGDVINADLIGKKEGSSVTLDKVLMFAKGSDIRIGQPFLTDVKVTGKVERHFSAGKVIAFKYKRRKDSSRKIGHRQKLAAINIIKITA